MGHMRHHTILVTGSNEGTVRAAHSKAKRTWALPDDSIGTRRYARLVSEPVEAVTNGYWSFAIFPDGSKEGWEQSEWGDAMRGQFISYLRSLKYEDGSSPLSWVEVQYGDDEGGRAAIVNSSSDPLEVRSAR